MGTWSKTVFSRCGINPKRLQCFRKVSNFTVQRLSTSHRPPKQVLYFENTDRHDIPFSYPYQTVSQVTDFRVRTVMGGFQRRPELIRRRKPFSEQPDGQRLVHNLSYGLYDKCERIQQELTQTTLQLMGDRAIGGVGQLVLDIGCGYGFCLSVLCREGVSVMGIDMDLQALSDLQNKTESKYLPADAVHVIRSDVSRGLCFRENVFDWAVSISFLQWLCAGRNPVKLLRTFFRSLSVVLKPGSGAGIQFYPQNVGDVKRVVHEAQNYFKGALVSDYPHLDRGRKLFLILLFTCVRCLRMAKSQQTMFGTAPLKNFLFYVWCVIRLYIIGVVALLHQLFDKPPAVKANTQTLSGRTAIVTGGSAGIGYHISRLLARHGARVVIGSRLKKEADDAITEILQEQPDAKVYFIHLDLSSFKSVRRFADEFMHRGWPLHLLINNAGVMLVPHQVTEDGNEYHLQVNHLSHALLTSLLLPLLETSATEARLSHVINVTSVVHHVASMDPDTFGDECEGPWSYSPHNAYAASKLAILLYTKALSRRLGDQQSNVTVSAVHPGVVNTGLYQHIHWTIAWAFHIMKQYLFMKPEQAAQSVLHLAMMSNKQATSGGYYENGRQTTSSSQSNILTHQETVYTKTCKMIQTKLD